MNDSNLHVPASRSKTELSVQIDAELLEQLRHLTNDPSRVVEVALRQWLRNELNRDEDLSRNLIRNPPLPPRGEWND